MSQQCQMRFFHQDTFGTDGTVVANDFFGRIPPLTERFAQSGLLADVTPTGGQIGGYFVCKMWDVLSGIKLLFKVTVDLRCAAHLGCAPHFSTRQCHRSFFWFWLTNRQLMISVNDPQIQEVSRLIKLSFQKT